MKDKILKNLYSAACEHLKGIEVSIPKIEVIDVERVGDMFRVKIETPEFVGKMLTKNENGEFVEIESIESVTPVEDGHKVVFNTKPFK